MTPSLPPVKPPKMPKLPKSSLPWMAGGIAVLVAAGVLLWPRISPAAPPPPTPTPTFTPSPVPSDTPPPTATQVALLIVAPTPAPPTATYTPWPTLTPTPTPTAPPTLTLTATATETPTPTPTPTITPARLQALAPVIDTDPPPTPNADALAEAAFLNATTQLAASYAPALQGLQAQMELVNSDPLVVVDGQWARQTQTLLVTLRELNSQARLTITPARYVGVWGQMLSAVETLDVALTNLELGLGQLDGVRLDAYREDFRTAMALYNNALAQLQSFVSPALPTPMLSPTPIPRNQPG